MTNPRRHGRAPHCFALAAALALLADGAPALAQTPARPARPGRGSPITEAMQFARAFQDVARQVLPSVVSIFVEIASPTAEAAPMAPMPGFGGQQGSGDAPRVRRGAGSGVIIRADGTILTNNHVVEDATRIRVRLHDGRTFAARVLGTDPATDLAVIRVDTAALPVARLGDSDTAHVGEWVLAIGAPFGLAATVTHGVVSATGRGGIGATQIEDYVQTDASINPGNSGGPLVNLRGEVLGINTITVGRGSGVGFAVPSRLARFVTDQIIAGGRVQRGWLGIASQDVTPDLESAFATNGHGGALINQVSLGSPGASGGLQVGDVVVQINERDVRAERDLQRELSIHGVGDRVRVQVLRRGQRSTMSLTMAARPGEAPPRPPPPVPPAPPGPTGFGIMIDNVPPQISSRMGIPMNTGAVVVQVFRGGAADRAGLRPGDVVLQADGSQVRNSDDVITAARDGRATLLVRRGEAQHYIGIGTAGN